MDPRKARVLLTTLVSEQNAAYMKQIDKVDALIHSPISPIQHTSFHPHNTRFSPTQHTLFHPHNTHHFTHTTHPFHPYDKVYGASGGAVEPAFKIMAAYTETHAALKVRPV